MGEGGPMQILYGCHTIPRRQTMELKELPRHFRFHIQCGFIATSKSKRNGLNKRHNKALQRDIITEFQKGTVDLLAKDRFYMSLTDGDSFSFKAVSALNVDNHYIGDWSHACLFSVLERTSLIKEPCGIR
jgi:hypothetical protein